MPTPFAFEFQVTWADLDANNHLRNTAYFEYASQCRFLYFDACGFGPADFAALGIGPAVVSEEISYRKELRLLDRFTVQIACGGMTARKSRFVIVNRFLNKEGAVCAQLRSTAVWFNLTKRRPHLGARGAEGRGRRLAARCAVRSVIVAAAGRGAQGAWRIRPGAIRALRG